MKFKASLAFIVICGLVACSQALPAKRLTYYQQPAATRYYAAPQRMMFMRYVQPSHDHARSHQSAAALVAGDAGATGTYLEDCVHTGSDGAVLATAGGVQEDTVAAAAGHVAQSVAEAYPAETDAASLAEEEHKISVQVDLDQANSGEVSEHEAKEAREYNYDAPAGDAVATVEEVENSNAANAEGSSATVTAGHSGSAETEISSPAPAPAPVAPAVVPSKRYLPAKKKVIVKLEQATEDDSDNAIATQDDESNDDVIEENDDDVYIPVPVAPKSSARRPATRKPNNKAPSNQKPQPVGTFFPVDFGGATGGAIAIANSFSTGESGSATSHAIAYGNPDTARAHLRPSRRH